MEEGVKQFGADFGAEVEVWQTGHTTIDPAEQVKVVEDLVAQGVDAICVVPNSTPALEPVFKRARDAGIVIVTHEATDVVNADADVEAFSNKDYGEAFAKVLIDGMGGEGKFVGFVGTLTATSHNEWVDSSFAYIEKNAPKMECLGKIEAQEDSVVSYNRVLELMMVHPDLKGFQGSSGADAPGIGRAIEELGLQDSTVVVGTALVSSSSEYLLTGAIDVCGFWDPALAGYAMNEIALHVLKGGKLDTLAFKAEGYQNYVIDGINVYGSAWIHATKENMNLYDY
jgi:simple sugar transport system substrate-binding protein